MNRQGVLTRHRIWKTGLAVVCALTVVAKLVRGYIELILHLVVLAIAVAAPRFKVYAYRLVIVPSYYVATHSTRLPRAVPLLLIACLTTNTWITRPEYVALIASYFSWFIVFGAWTLYVYELREGKLLQEQRPQRAT